MTPEIEKNALRHPVSGWQLSKKRANLLPDFMYGKYDNVIRTIAGDIKRYGQHTLLGRYWRRGLTAGATTG